MLRLEKCRELRAAIERKETELTALRGAAGSLGISRVDGMPHAKQNGSAVEKIAIKLTTLEKEISLLRSKLDETTDKLLNVLMAKVVDAKLLTVLILRYVECLSFRRTAAEMNYSPRQIFRLHDRAKKIFEQGGG